MFNLSLIGFVLIELVILLLAKLIVFCYRKNARATLIGLPSLIIILALSFYFARVRDSCDEWSKGAFGDNQIDRKSGDYCEVLEPESCPIDIFDGFMDMTAVTFYSCKNEYNSFEKL